MNLIKNAMVVFLALLASAPVQAELFEVRDLSKESRQEMIAKRIWKNSCPVDLYRLKLVKFSYYDFNGVKHDNGEMVVFDVVAPYILEIFRGLYELKFPINKAKTIENYNGNDDDSMTDNNSSCFNCREITGGGGISIHAYGLAIDVNPIHNPYIVVHEVKNNKEAIMKIVPASGRDYLNRANIRPGMVEPIVSIFKKKGFSVWGGNWNDRLDWQHFQLPRPLAELLAVMTYKDGAIFFGLYLPDSKLMSEIDPQDNRLISFYKNQPEAFIRCLKKHRKLLKQSPEQVYKFLSNEITASNKISVLP